MDAFVLTQALERPKEKYGETPTVVGGNKAVTLIVAPKFTLMKTIQLVLSLAISAYAVYLSWTCSVGEHAFIRVLSAIFAGFFGVLYIFYYMLFKSRSCKAM
jgi:hypothetical protein